MNIISWNLKFKKHHCWLVKTVFAVISILICVHFLDLPLAKWIENLLLAKAPYVRSSNLPDLLLLLVVVLTILSWTAYFYLLSKRIYNRNTLFCQVTGTVLPLAMGAKFVTKWLFGRTDTRIWLLEPDSYGFHWCAGEGKFEGFPSGHMLVLTPLFLALWYFYPRFRFYYGFVWLALALALIVTEYHFLGDVIAGAYVGACVYFGVYGYLIANQREKNI